MKESLALMHESQADSQRISTSFEQTKLAQEPKSSRTSGLIIPRSFHDHHRGFSLIINRLFNQYPRRPSIKKTSESPRAYQLSPSFNKRTFLRLPADEPRRPRLPFYSYHQAKTSQRCIIARHKQPPTENNPVQQRTCALYDGQKKSHADESPLDDSRKMLN